jgi:hypothetical protein
MLSFDSLLLVYRRTSSKSCTSYEASSQFAHMMQLRRGIPMGGGPCVYLDAPSILRLVCRYNCSSSMRKNVEALEVWKFIQILSGAFSTGCSKRQEGDSPTKDDKESGKRYVSRQGFMGSHSSVTLQLSNDRR